ncbi:hypothetical protein KPC83_02915 [Collinsella sp. zg1085]|uniref:hypothetical protein n=1 Tax=Collinsella sp. zg1085 TaxID=2844380 RepID=UPI001C0AE165|nr:hypothetical protein [Collinsella sp. zg1085]QWT18096.1 hypothetical protein KPC83_02915 [Collinsella sp. zg1085]
MDKISFTVEGIEGKFYCDADELKSYKTMKQLALSEKHPDGLFEAVERIYMGHDEDYVERVGGFTGLAKLNDAALEAARVKNSLASSPVLKNTETK